MLYFCQLLETESSVNQVPVCHTSALETTFDRITAKWHPLQLHWGWVELTLGARGHVMICYS